MFIIALDFLMSLHLKELFQVAQINGRGRFSFGSHNRSAEAIELPQYLEDIALGAEHAPDFQLAGVGKFIDNRIVERIGHRNRNNSPAL